LRGGRFSRRGETASSEAPRRGHAKMTGAAAIDLGTEWVEDSRRLLAAAFKSDPVVRYVCDAASEAFEERRHALYASLVRLQVESGEPRLGVVHDGRLVAVCHLLRPAARMRLWAEAMHALRLLWKLGPSALVRGAHFVRVAARCHPVTPHWYVVTIAVDPASRGQGYAGVLLRAIHERSEDDPGSTGVALDTQNPRNVTLYERFGYRVTREEDVGPIHSCCMLRPDTRSRRTPGSPPCQLRGVRVDSANGDAHL
jgi:ribosomal protein S18 acetylase RimI-like enzyme